MTRRVRIAPLRRSDEREFLAAVARSRKLHAPWVAPPATPEAFRAMLKRMRAPSHFTYTARRLDSGALVGIVEITQVVRGHFRSAYLGYYAFAGHDRQGLMTEALARIVRLAFTKLDLHRLEANTQPGNRASIALARACGFRYEGYSPRYLKIRGRWRDHERWAVTRDDDRRAHA